MNRLLTINSMRNFVTATILIVIMLVSAHPSLADVIVSTVVFQGSFDNGIGGFDDARFETSTSPFADSYSIGVGDWGCSSQFHGNFDASQGSFAAADMLQARDAGYAGQVITRGGTLLRNTADVLITVESVLDYSAPGNYSDVEIFFNASRFDFPSGDSTLLWSDWQGWHSNAPSMDTLRIDGTFVLPAISENSVYDLEYALVFYTNGGSPGTNGLLSGSGSVEWSYSTIPEPASVGFLAAFALCTRLNRTCQRRLVRPSRVD